MSLCLPVRECVYSGGHNIRPVTMAMLGADVCQKLCWFGARPLWLCEASEE